MALSTLEVALANESLGYIGEYEIESGDTTSKQYRFCDRFYSKSRDETLKRHPWNEAMVSVILIEDSTLPLFGYDRRYSLPSDLLRVVSVDDDLGATVRCNSQGVNAWETEGDYILSNAGLTPQTWATDTEYIDGEYVSITPTAWATGKAYIIGEYKKSGTTVYEVLADHTSSTISADVTAGNIISRGTGTTVSYEVLVTHTSNSTESSTEAQQKSDISAGNISASGAGPVDARIVFVRYVKQLTDTTKFTPLLREAIAKALAIKVITPLTNDTKGKFDLINEFESLIMPKARGVDGMEGKPRPIFNSSWNRSRSQGTASYRR